MLLHLFYLPIMDGIWLSGHPFSTSLKAVSPFFFVLLFPGKNLLIHVFAMLIRKLKDIQMIHWWVDMQTSHSKKPAGRVPTTTKKNSIFEENV